MHLGRPPEQQQLPVMARATTRAANVNSEVGTISPLQVPMYRCRRYSNRCRFPNRTSKSTCNSSRSISSNSRSSSSSSSSCIRSSRNDTSDSRYLLGHGHSSYVHFFNSMHGLQHVQGIGQILSTLMLGCTKAWYSKTILAPRDSLLPSVCSRPCKLF